MTDETRQKISDVLKEKAEHGQCRCGRRSIPHNADYCFLCSRERNPEVDRLFKDLESRMW